MKTPPHSESAEQSVLGALLLKPSLLPAICEVLDTEDFYREVHRRTFEAVLSLDQRGEVADTVTVIEHMRDHWDLIDNGAYLIGLANDTPGPANAMGYARIVKEKSRLRRLIDIGTRLIEAAYDGEDANSALEHGSRALLDQSGPEGSISITDLAREYLEAQEERSGATGIRPLLVDCSKVSGPWMPSDFVVLAARPSMGKTAAAIQIAIKAAMAGVPVEFMSLEMSRDQLLTRACQHLSGSPLPRDMADWDQGHHDALGQAMRLLKGLPLYVDDSPDLDPLRLRWKVRAAARSRGVRLVILDYLQLIQPSMRGRSLYEAVTESSRACKAAAKGSGVVVLALSQLSREIEKRSDKRPSLADLRESGQIEQDADQVIFLHSDSYYKGERGNQDLVEWIWGKNRHGRVGAALSVWRPDKQRFYDADPSIYQELEERRQQAKRGPYT